MQIRSNQWPNTFWVNNKANLALTCERAYLSAIPWDCPAGYDEVEQERNYFVITTMKPVQT